MKGHALCAAGLWPRQEGPGGGSQLSSLFCQKSCRLHLSVSKGRFSRVELSCSSCIPPPSLCHHLSATAAWALAQVTGSAQAQSSTVQLFHWNGLLNPTTECVPWAFSRGFNNLHWPCLLAGSLGSSSCYWALSLTLPLVELFLLLDPCPGSSRGQDSQALPLAFLDSGPVHPSASLTASSGLGCIWPLVPVSVPDGAWAGRDPVTSWAAQRSNLPGRAQRSSVLLVYTGFLCLIFGMFLWCSQQHFGILVEIVVKQIEPALSL